MRLRQLWRTALFSPDPVPHKFGHKTISERLEDYYGKPIEEIEPSREEEINWSASVGDELL